MSTRLVLVSALFLGLPSGLAAQRARAGPQPSRFANAAPESLERLAPTPVPLMMHAPAPLALGSVAPATHHGKKEGVVLMLVGAGGLVTGLIVDESVITIAGAGVGGFGLYLYLR